MKEVKSLHCLILNCTTEFLELKFDYLDFELGTATTYNLKLKYLIHSVHPTQCISVDLPTKTIAI